VFGRSSDKEIAAFLSKFNQTVRETAVHTPGHLPHSFYHFDVEEVSSCIDGGFVVQEEGREERFISGTKAVARIHLGTHTTRFDIVIPWKAVHVLSNFQGSYRLELPKGPLSLKWITLFTQLAGTAVGVGIQEDLRGVGEFFGHFFPHLTPGTLSLRMVNLEVLLALAGYNSPRTNITALNFFFTGGIVLKTWEMRCGFGLWGSTSALPDSLSLYLQSEAVGVLNTVLVCLCSLLLHMFPTPGIAARHAQAPPAVFRVVHWVLGSSLGGVCFHSGCSVQQFC
jgi:hypothetical protein